MLTSRFDDGGVLFNSSESDDESGRAKPSGGSGLVRSAPGGLLASDRTGTSLLIVASGRHPTSSADVKRRILLVCTRYPVWNVSE